MLVSHAPARELATIQSRCRKLMLRPLDVADVVRAAAEAADLDPAECRVASAAEAAEGSVARALTLLAGQSLGLRSAHARSCCNSLPNVDQRALHALATRCRSTTASASKPSSTPWTRWLTDHLRAPEASEDPRAALHGLPRYGKDQPRRARHGKLQFGAETLVFSVFGMLAEATR